MWAKWYDGISDFREEIRANSQIMDFLTLKPEIFGLDISDLSLKIIKLKKRGRFLGLASFGEAEIKPGIIEKGEIKDQNLLVETIKASFSKIKGEKLKTKYVIASLPEEKAFLHIIKMPKMEEREVKKAVYFEAENHIPLPLEKVYLDAQVVSSLRGDSEHVDVLVVALPKEIVDSYFSVLYQSGLKPLAFEVEFQAISRALIKNEINPKFALLVDLGAVKTGLAFFSGHSLRFTTSIPALSQDFTEKELAEQIKKHLEYYQSHLSHEDAKKSAIEVLLCGGRANLKGLPDLFSRELKLRVSLGNPWINILPRPLKEVPELSFEESLRYATALGLALYNPYD